MQISLKHNFAFLCLPKCGSTSVENALRAHSEITLSLDPSLKHMNARKFNWLIRPLLEKLTTKTPAVETFCIIREPIERVQSWYAYQTRVELSKPSHPNHQRYTGNITFAEFVEACLASDKPPYARIGSAYDFIRLNDGSIGVDRIFRLDNMAAVNSYLSQKIGSTIEIPRHNTSPAKLSFNLPDALKARLRVLLDEDYRIYEKFATK